MSIAIIMKLNSCYTCYIATMQTNLIHAKTAFTQYILITRTKLISKIEVHTQNYVLKGIMKIQ